MDDLDDAARFDLVSDAIRTITGAPMPRLGQIKAVTRLVFEKKDTVLVAATGYGKSAVLYAFSSITEMITIQIVPLTKLGQNQLEDIIKNVPNAKPVWIDGDTHLKNPRVWDQVEASNYTHILLSPEQALNPKFKAVLRSPQFHEKIGLFAIDELHCVGEWRDFRQDYTYLHTLRSLLPSCVPWFGCTATLDKDNQDFILKQAGFHPIGPAGLEIIRTSVDRPEISLVVQPLLRGSTRDHRRLQFLVEKSSPTTVRQIPKTIIYLDSKSQITSARYTLIRYLRRKCGFTKAFARKVIRRYDADVRETDKDIIYRDFANTDTDCRVIVATISLGMGMDIPDVERVVQFGLPPSPSIADIWQRFRRAMRKKGGQGTAYFFVPYWVFDHLGTTEKQVKPKRQKKPRANQPHAPAIPSRLRMSLVERDEDEISSQASDISQASQASDAPPPDIDLTLDDPTLISQNLFDFDRRVKWAKSDLNQREKLDPMLMVFLNASCFRKYALEYLQEPLDDPHLEYKKDMTPGQCCNACNHSLGRIPPLSPREKKQEKPSTGSLAGTALKHLSAWCKIQAQDLVPAARRRFDIIPEMWLDLGLQHGIARLFSQKRGKQELPFSDIQELAQKLPELKEWEHFEARGVDIAAFCINSVAQVHEDWAATKADKAKEKENRRASAAVALSPDASRKRAAEDAQGTPVSKR